MVELADGPRPDSRRELLARRFRPPPDGTEVGLVDRPCQ